MHSLVFGLLNFFIFYFADFHIVVDHLFKRILKGYSFDWNVNFFLQFMKKYGKGRNEMKWKRTEKDPKKYVYYFEIDCFF